MTAVMATRSPSVRTGNIASSSSNAWRACAPRRWRWWTISSRKTSPWTALQNLLKLQKSDATLPKVLPPHPREKRIVFKNIDREGWTNDLACYVKDGGYKELKKALKMKPEEIVDEVKKSGLAGAAALVFRAVQMGFHQTRRPQADLFDLQCG
jgi:hypothetical protein